jgi:hypothetical protein
MESFNIDISKMSDWNKVLKVKEYLKESNRKYLEKPYDEKKLQELLEEIGSWTREERGDF